MNPDPILEGTGDEIAVFVRDHPFERFRLIALPDTEPAKRRGPGSESWEELMQLIHSVKGKTRRIPFEATSTEALYD